MYMIPKPKLYLFWFSFWSYFLLRGHCVHGFMYTMTSEQKVRPKTKPKEIELWFWVHVHNDIGAKSKTRN